MPHDSFPKRQHYVPASYLRRWVTAGTGSLFAFDKQTGKVHQVAPTDAAVQKYFYHLPGENQDVEQMFSQMEGDVKPVVDEIISRGTAEGLNAEYRKRLDRFLAYQGLRTQEHRTSMEQTINPILEMVRKHGTDELKAQAEGWDARDVHMATLRDGEKYVPFVSRLLLFTMKNGGTRTFTTSDHPVGKDNNAPHIPPQERKRGLGSPGVELHLPLSPDFSLMAVDAPPRLARAMPRRMVANDAHVEYARFMQFANAGRFIYSARDDFDLERAWRAKHPELVTADRPRVKIEGGLLDGTPTPIRPAHDDHTRS